MIALLKTATGSAVVLRGLLPESGPVPRVVRMGSRSFVFHGVSEHGVEFREAQSCAIDCPAGLDPQAQA